MEAARQGDCSSDELWIHSWNKLKKSYYFFFLKEKTAEELKFMYALLYLLEQVAGQASYYWMKQRTAKD